MVSRVMAVFCGLCLSVLVASNVAAVEVEGVKVDESRTVNGQTLVLNGVGVRSKFFIDLYVGALYLPSKTSDADTLLAADETQAIVLHVISGRINSDNMTEATLEGFENSTGGNLAPIQNEVDQLLSVFADEISEGDTFELVYVPEEGVRVIKNGQLGQTIGDRHFKEALFGIWLGNEPAQDSLKEDMLDD